MKRLLVLLYVFLVLVFITKAQVIIEGRVVDGNNAPIGYVTIGIKGTTRSVMSNEQGYFKVTVPSLPQVLVCSSIGFESKEETINASKAVIHLHIKTYTIKNVTIVGDAAYRVFKKAYRKLQKPGYRSYEGKVFCRLVTQNDSTYTELLEGFYDAQIALTGFLHWKLKHGRYALAEDYHQQHYVKSIDLSGLVQFMDITNDHQSGIAFPLFPFRTEANSGYDFSFNGTTHLSNKEVTKVIFKPKKDFEDAFSGTAYIDEETGKLYRLETQYSRPVSNLIRSDVGDVPASQLSISYIIDYTEAPTGEMQLSWIDVDLTYTYKRMSIPRNIHTQIQCFVFDKGKPQRKMNRQGRFSYSESDYEAIRSRLYIKPFWDENTVVTQTGLQEKVIHDFEKNGSFGQTYNQGTDTSLVTKEGYAILDTKVNRLIAALPADSFRNTIPSCVQLKINGRQHAALCCQLFVAHNCYKDSFYISVLPLLDTSLTWVSDSAKMEASFSFTLSLYSRLTLVHAKQLKRQIMQIVNPCENEDKIRLLVNKANEDLHKDQVELLTDLWLGDNFKFWYKFLEIAEKEN